MLFHMARPRLFNCLPSCGLIILPITCYLLPITYYLLQVRLSDFGLSKVMSPAGGAAGAAGAAGTVGPQHGMELTSYGSGTHGYLPPECYEGDGISRVCPKVDVFSAGVVHYLMLFYPNKPFFKHASQQQILQMKPSLIRQVALTHTLTLTLHPSPFTLTSPPSLLTHHPHSHPTGDAAARLPGQDLGRGAGFPPPGARPQSRRACRRG